MFKSKQQKPDSINLMRRMEKGISDKFLTWAFTVGRAILMVVYALALGAFLYRFGLDREIIDLRDKIKDQQTLVSLSEANETKFRTLQEKLSFIKTQSALATDEITLLDNIIRLATGKILFNSLDILPDSVNMEGSVRSIGALNGFIDDMKALPQVKSVSLTKLESRVDQGVISFTLTVTL